MKSPYDCVACGSDRTELCGLLGHTYPVKAKVISLQRLWGIVPDPQRFRGPLRPPVRKAPNPNRCSWCHGPLTDDFFVRAGKTYCRPGCYQETKDHYAA